VLFRSVGEPNAAAVAFHAAITAGFLEFEGALSDPDLQGELHQTIQDIVQAEREKLAKEAQELGFQLSYNEWTDFHPLQLHSPSLAMLNDGGTKPRLRLQWQDIGLAFELRSPSPWEAAIHQDNPPPWRGGSGLMITLGVPTEPDRWDLTNHDIFAFGVENKAGVGGMYLASQGNWQRVRELSPKIRVDEQGDWVLSGVIPWQAIMPYYPVVDTPMGFNATLYMHGPGGLQRASLSPTQDTLLPEAKHRRMVRLDFATETLRKDLFLGKLNTSLSSSSTGALTVDLVAISNEAGRGQLSLDFIDQSGRSVLPDGASSGAVTMQVGSNTFVRQADFSSLNTGGYVVQAELTFPSGKISKWAGTVLQLQEGWRAAYEDRISYVGYSEQATARHLMGKILESIASHEPRRSPGPILTAMFTLDNMLTDAQESGTILPDKGIFAFVYPGPDGSDRICRMYLPAGREHADAVNPILVLSPFSGQESQLAARIGRNYEFGDQKPTQIGRAHV